MAVKYKLTGTDEHNIISSVEFNGDFTDIEDWEEFFIKLFVSITIGLSTNPSIVIDQGSVFSFEALLQIFLLDPNS